MRAHTEAGSNKVYLFPHPNKPFPHTVLSLDSHLLKHLVPCAANAGREQGSNDNASLRDLMNIGTCFRETRVSHNLKLFETSFPLYEIVLFFQSRRAII